MSTAPLKYIACVESCFPWANQHIEKTFDNAETFRIIRDMGYDGIAIAPRCLGESPITEWSPDQCRDIGRQVIDAGFPLGVYEHHWIASGFPDIHLTASDKTLRTAMKDHLREIADVNAWIAEGMGGDRKVRFSVFGSPPARTLRPDVGQKAAFSYAVEIFAEACPYFSERGQQLLIEPLANAETDFITTVPDALALIDAVRAHDGSLGYHADVKALAKGVATQEQLEALLDRFLPKAAHFHANDRNGHRPGGPQKIFDFIPILRRVRAAGLVVSVEPFEFMQGEVRDPWGILRSALCYLKDCAAEI